MRHHIRPPLGKGGFLRRDQGPALRQISGARVGAISDRPFGTVVVGPSLRRRNVGDAGPYRYACHSERSAAESKNPFPQHRERIPPRASLGRKTCALRKTADRGCSVGCGFIFRCRWAILQRNGWCPPGFRPRSCPVGLPRWIGRWPGPGRSYGSCCGRYPPGRNA